MLDHPHPPADLDAMSDRDLQLALAAFNAKRFDPAFPDGDWRAELDDFSAMSRIEGAYLDRERQVVATRAAEAPTTAKAFTEWFEELKASGPGQGDALFPWLAETASMDQMKWFLTQEVAGEAGFEDLTALTQVKLPTRPKLELARNYWDEMGRGKPKGMHGPLLEALAHRLGLKPDVETTVPESLALANTMAGLAANRRFAYHSVGALGVIEMTAPDRAAAVATGLKRLGIPTGDRHYFDLHSILDVKHSLAWNAEAIYPLVEADPRTAHAMAEGALMRLQCGARCFAAYREYLGFKGDQPPA